MGQKGKPGCIDCVDGICDMNCGPARSEAGPADLVKALEQIRDGLADTGSTKGQWMTKITKADAHRIAAGALARHNGQ